MSAPHTQKVGRKLILLGEKYGLAEARNYSKGVYTSEISAI